MQTEENEGITFTGIRHKLIANSFHRQFTTSNPGKHSSDSTAGVYDQQLPERSKHLPEK